MKLPGAITQSFNQSFEIALVKVISAEIADIPGEPTLARK